MIIRLPLLQNWLENVFKILKKIWACIKVSTKLGHSVKLIFTDYGEVYGSHNVSYETVRRWRKIYHTGTLLKMLQSLDDL